MSGVKGGEVREERRGRWRGEGRKKEGQEERGTEEKGRLED